RGSEKSKEGGLRQDHSGVVFVPAEPFQGAATPGQRGRHWYATQKTRSQAAPTPGLDEHGDQGKGNSAGRRRHGETGSRHRFQEDEAEIGRGYAQIRVLAQTAACHIGPLTSIRGVALEGTPRPTQRALPLSAIPVILPAMMSDSNRRQ